MQEEDRRLIDIHCRTILLDKLFLRSSRRVPAEEVAEWIRRGQIRASIDPYIEDMIFELNTFIHALPEQKIEIDEEWPETWWDAFKDRWFPNWLIALFPAQYKSIHVKKTIYKAVCPHIPDIGGTHLCFKWLANQQGERGHD